MTSHTKSTDWRRAAAVVAAGVLAAAGVIATSTPAAAQFRREDGRALDSNRRVGGGRENDAGSNNGYGRSGPMVTGNQIITGNVTAGREFRGPVPYTDPGNFRGITSGSFSSDRFVRETAGVPRAYAPEVDLSRPSAYYGSGRAAPPPVGYLPTAGATGGYIPSGDAVARPNYELTRTYSPTLDPTLRARELIMPGAAGPDGESTLSASPLYGVRVWRAGENPGDFQAGRDGRTGDRFGADRDAVQRMRDELNRAGLGNTDEQPGAQDAGAGDGPEGATGAGQGRGAAGGLQQPLNQSIGAAESPGREGGSVAAGAMRGAIGSGVLQNSVATNQSIRRNLLVAADRQTPQLARLRQAFERQQQVRGAASDVDAARQFNRELQASRQRPQGQAGAQQGQPGQPGQPGQAGQPPLGGGAGGLPSAPPSTRIPPAAGDDTPGTAPAPGGAAGEGPGTTPEPTAPPPAPAEPQRIESIAEGVEAQGLRSVLKSAEDLMREQKFAEALQQYDVAQQVAPNNPLIVMGRANAELGASYYRRAETSMRDAVSRAPELVVAQFDLRALVGEERLQVLVRDLKELAAADPKAVRPPLLLGYIAYNTGNEDQAGQYLAAAEQAAGGDDPLLKAWRRNWKLGAATTTAPAAAPELNK